MEMPAWSPIAIRSARVAFRSLSLSLSLSLSRPVNIQTNPAALSDRTFSIALSTVTSNPPESSHVHATNIFKETENKTNK